MSLKMQASPTTVKEGDEEDEEDEDYKEDSDEEEKDEESVAEMEQVVGTDIACTQAQMKLFWCINCTVTKLAQASVN